MASTITNSAGSGARPEKQGWQELILYQACPLCQSSAIVEHKTGDCSGHPLYKPALSPTMIWNMCKSCGHIFRNGYYGDEACKLIFSDTHEHQKLGHNIEQQRPVSAYMVEKILPFHSSGDWLDVGFGNGSLLFTAQEFGFTPVGIDLRKTNTDALSSLGIEAYCQPIESLEFVSRFSVISMADVLEHMPFPIEGLQAALRLLVDEGVLFISMPNSESMLWRTWDLHNQNPYWGEMEHYHNFSRSRLYALLAEHGFTPIRYGISLRYRGCMEVVALKGKN